MRCAVTNNQRGWPSDVMIFVIIVLMFVFFFLGSWVVISRERAREYQKMYFQMKKQSSGMFFKKDD